MVGKTISHYKILDKIGEGGMGVVYRAYDGHLDRNVALKVLPPEAVANTERRKRFVLEAKSASALNHPNIVHIYDIDSAEGVDFIAMEYVAGKTLDELIPRKGMRLNEALRIAVQVSDALAAAHEAGIIHRDIKPGNIIVGDDSRVRVLDFGLAKLTEQHEVDDEGETRTIKAPSSGPHTEDGVIVGTVNYMSPEQAEGRSVDARSDVFSFGSVLYEMVTGRRAFEGDSKMSTLAKIITKEPEPLNAKIPYDLNKTVHRCLRKDRSRRFQHMDDVGIALEELKEELDSGRLVPSSPEASTFRRRWIYAAAVAATAFVTGIGLTVWVTRSKEPTFAPRFKLRQLTKDPGLSAEPALSPDGKLIAYASDRAEEGSVDIWVQQVAGGGSVRLTNHVAADHSPAFSPDGTTIVFRSERDGGGIYSIPALGGEPRLVARDGQRPRFSPDGSRIAYFVGAAKDFEGSKLFVMPATGGTPKQLASDFDMAVVPVWTPDGEHLLFVGIHPTEGVDLWVTPIEGGSPRKIEALESLNRQGLWVQSIVAFVSEGNYAVLRGTLGDASNLWKLPISPVKWRCDGPAERLTFGVGEHDASVGPGGRIAFSSYVWNNDVWSLPIDPIQGVTTGETRRLTDSPSDEYSPDVSADGTTVVFLSNKGGTRDVWVKDLVSGRETALTRDSKRERFPAISADGSKVAFHTYEEDTSVIHVVPTSGGLAESVCRDCGEPRCWLPGGGRILWEGHGAIHLLELDSRKSTQVLHMGAPPYSGAPDARWSSRISPGGRWIAFKEDIAPNRSRIFVAPLEDSAQPTKRKWQPVTKGISWDDKPRWSPDGNMIYFTSDRDGFRCIWACRLEPASKQPLGDPFPVHHFHQLRPSMLTVDRDRLGLAVAPDRLIFPLNEMTGNIWMMEPAEE